MNKFILGGFLVGCLALSACDEQRPSADEVQQHAQEQISEQGNQSVGMPAITNFAEKRLMKTILEMRDDPKLTTFTYTQDMNGKLHKRCNSIGYGLPYATQYTNPQKPTYNTQAVAILPQADPNGLFSPASAAGTWVLCHDPKSDKLYPVYFEPDVIVSPFELPSD